MSARLGAGLLMSALVVLTAGPSENAWGRVNPLTSIEHQIQKPNFLLMLDTSQSMFEVPGGDDQDFYEAGIDCDNGDSYCRTVGTKGRCFFTSSGKNGTGVFHDFEECTTDAQCTDVSYCKLHHPNGCRTDADCNTDDGETCHSKLCTPVPSSGVITCNSNADCDASTSDFCTKVSGNFCVKNTTTQATIQMCRLSQTMCLNDSHCQSLPGDSCGPASSRMVIAKRVISRVVQEFRDTVNFGFMTFQQKNYFPYFEVTGTVSTTTRTTFLGRALLETAPTPCFSSATGPTASCSLNGVTYTLKAISNSRYQLNVGGAFSNSDYSWGAAGASCGVECGIPGVGTGIYQGSYYTFPYETASATKSADTTFPDYVGRTRVSGGKTYIYYDPSSGMRHVDNVYRDDVSHPFSGGSSTSCKAVWDSTRWPFMDTSAALPQANAITMARKIALLTDKVGLGGLFATGGTPMGDAFKGKAADGCENPEDSAYHYIKEVQAKNATNGVACRPDAVLLVTDGVPGGDCASAQCALSPPGAGCDCTAVTNAYAIRRDLGAKVYVVGFSGTPASSVYATTIINNVARAGGTTAYFASREDLLYQGITSAIYEAARGSYSTSPLTGGNDANGVGQVLLDARADFPEWRGHLVTYDVSGASPTVQWDAASYFDATTYPDFWKTRNVWTSSGSTMVKIQVDASGTVTNAAALRALGLATTDAEAALAARWLLGDPAMRNPAPLGAMINSSPIEVTVAGGPSLIYVGASDGMLHAFHSRTQSVGGTSYSGGQEAFAYIPEDMLPMVRRLFAQGGQRPNPSEHLFGLANSPKVRRICTANCAAGTAAYKTVLVMPEGFGGNDLFALDISAPHGPSGILSAAGTPPVQLLWDTDTTVSAADKATLDGALGKTISLPAFFFGKSATMDDTRVVYASGYSEETDSTQGLALVTASAATGAYRSKVSASGLGAACAKPRVDPTEPTLLADVAVARNFGISDSERIAAAYVGDTWGNLFRWVPPIDGSNNIAAGNGTINLVESYSCSQPLHLPPTIVQLDRYDPAKSPGAIYIAQLTNSAHDPLTSAVTGAFPASQLVIRKDLSQPGGSVVADGTFAGTGKITLSSSNPAQICAVWNAAASSCTTPMPAGARPLSSAIGVLKSDFDGFVLITLWYIPDSGGCNKGASYLTIHEISSTGSAHQTHGEKIGDEPVIGSVFSAGKLYITRSDGPHAVATSNLKTVVATTPSGERFRRTGWTELP
jgi:hypothetical protein